MKNNIVSSKFVKYVISSVIVSAINILVYYLFYNIVYSNVIVSNIVSYTISITLNFIINKKIIFESSRSNIFLEIVLFMFMKFISFCIDSTVLLICKDVLNIPNLYSKIISNCSTVLNNYIMNKKLVFKEKN